MLYALRFRQSIRLETGFTLSRINWKVFGTWGTCVSVAYGIIAINTASVSENTQKY